MPSQPPVSGSAAVRRSPTGSGVRPAARLVRVPLEYPGTVVTALRALRRLPHAFALTGRWAGGGAVLGAAPLVLLAEHEDPWQALNELPRLPGTGSGAVGGGWFGYLGYGLGSRVEELPPRPPRPQPLPDFHLAYYDHVVRLDADGAWWLEGLAAGECDESLDERMRRTADLLVSSRSDEVALGPAGPFEVTPPGHSGHRWAVAEAVERIAAGDLFQVNLALRLESRWRADVVELFARAATALAPAYGAVFATGWGGLVSLSPELFLRRAGGTVVTGPIKGTVRRPGAARGNVERELLLGSEKDAAEHVMIVDLMRNDLGRVCDYGSVTREQRRRVEAHPGLWHLVSEVSGSVSAGVGDGDLVRAAFPPGSVTGAPKVQSMRMIAELEATGREIYTGAIGFASPCAGLELSVAIRTFEVARDRVWLGAGGGVVADSRPSAELDEALSKAAPLVAAAGGCIRRERRIARNPENLLRATAVGPRPDPALGVMETVRVSGGVPLDLAQHLDRLGRSVRSLYGAELPDDVVEAAEAAAAGRGDVRLRIHAVPVARELRLRFETAALPAPGPPLRLTPVLIPGGLGEHKWRDRRLLEQLTRITGSVPLLVDASGEVLEVAWANVWAVLAGEHRTPPADGRILAGIARQRRLRELAAGGTPHAVRPLSLGELRGAEIYLTSSLRRSPAVLDA